MNEKKKSTKSDKMLNLILSVIVIAVLAVGVYATYGKLSENIKDKAIQEGTAEATVEYLAKQSGMSVDDYLAQYGLSIGDTITKNTTESEMIDNMTIENYLQYNGGSQTADEVIEEAGLQDQVTKDTLWKDFMAMVPVSSVIGEDSFNQLKEQMGLGDDVTADMPYGEFEELMQEKQNAADEADDTAEENAEEGAADEAPAE